MKFDIKNLSDNAIELFFYGEIVGDELEAWSYDDQYPSAVRDFLTDNKGKEVHVRINSGGGSCFSGICIGEMLKNHNGKTVAHVDGLCASIATYIACCCDEIRIHKNSYFMCHCAWCSVTSNKHGLLETIALLEKMDNSIAEVYMKHTNKSIEEIREMMDAETWMCGAEILDTFNFIMEEEEEKVAYAKVDFKNYKNIPESLKAQLEEEAKAEDEEVVEDDCKKKPDDKCEKDDKKCLVMKCPECDYEGEFDMDEEGNYVCPECGFKLEPDKEEEPDIDEDMEDSCKTDDEKDTCKKKEKAQAEAKKELEFLKAKMFLDNFK